MILDYTIEDIEKYIAVAKTATTGDENQSLQKLLNVSHKIAIFEGISKEELKALVYDVRFKRYTKSETIITQNESSEEVFFLLRGECHALQDGKTIGKLYEGDTFGEIGVITRTPRSASVVSASEETLLLSYKIDEENLDFNAKAIATLYRNLASAINDKLQKLNIAAVRT